ncbi:MAG: GMC family oxidoreductase N-terminal domain-containing protein, partial [Blastocatellia bacterium]
LMVVLCFIGAYNRNVRFYSTVGLFTGHLASTVASLGFYFYDRADTFPPINAATAAMPTYRNFLLTSAGVDGVMVIIFAWILIKYRADSRLFAPRKEFSDYVSLPDTLTKWFFYAFAALMALLIPAFLGLRLFGGGESGPAAVFGYPDPQLGNTITMLATMSVIGLLLSRRERLREYLTAVLALGLIITLAGKALYVPSSEFLGHNRIYTRNGTATTVDWYFIIAAAGDALLLATMLGLRKLFYNIDYAVNSLNPTSAQNVMALHDALYAEGPVATATVLQKIDQYVGDIKGRKRGLLNFPFWIVEQVLSPVYNLHPTFSSMSPAEGRHFLRKYILRPPAERSRSFIPALAELAYKLGMATDAFVTFAHYTQIKGWEEAGYIPPDARDRLQGDYPSKAPPFTAVAPLPDGPQSPANNKPDSPPARPLIAPRLSTPVSEPDIPDSVDYLIIGSGAGGACMAYRLACMVPDPSRILVVDRGPRYSPLQDFNDDEMNMVCKLYKEGGLQQTKRFDLMVLQGECVGGTTVINNAVCLPMPSQIRQMWEKEYGLDLSSLGVYDGRGWPSGRGEYSDVAGEIEISEIPGVAINQRVKERFFSAVDKYNRDNGAPGKPALTKETLSANQRDMMGDGLCNLGNRRLRKRSMLETYIPWAEARGVKVIGQTGAVCFQTDRDGRRAESVVLRTAHGVLKTVKVSKAVIVAGGVIASSQFLMTSGVKKNIGQGMS